MYETRTNKTRRRRTLRLRGIILIGGVLLLIVILLFVFGVFKLPSLGGSKNSALDFTSDNPYVYTGSGFLYVRDNLLVSLPLDKGKEWTQQLVSGDVSLSASPQIYAVYNPISIQPISSEGTKLVDNALDIRGTILDVRCGTSMLAVHKLDDYNSPVINVFDAKGMQLDGHSFKDSTVVDFGFFGKDDHLYVIYVNTSGVSITTTISIYEAGAAHKGLITLDGQTVEGAYFTDTGLYVAGTTYLMTFDNTYTTEDAQKRRLIYGWEVLDFQSGTNRNYFLLTPRPQSGGHSSVAKLINTADEKEVALTLPASNLGTFLCGENIVSVTANELLFYNMSGALVYTQALDDPITGVEKLDAKRLLLKRGSALYLMQVKNRK